VATQASIADPHNWRTWIADRRFADRVSDVNQGQAHADTEHEDQRYQAERPTGCQHLGRCRSQTEQHLLG
jgi:hypothetical protein